MTTAAKHPFLVYGISIIAALAGLLFGYDVGIISGALLFIKHSFVLTDTQQGLIVSAVPFGALVGAAVCGFFSDLAGRKKLLILTAFLFGAGSILCAMAGSPNSLVEGRFILGFAVGLGSFSAPIYIAELSPRKRRGALVTFNQLAITIGISLSYAIDYAYAGSSDWRMMLGLGVVPAAVLFFLAFFLPESPRWLFEKNQTERAKAILERVHGMEVQLEMVEMTQAVQEEKLSFLDILSSNFVKVLGLGIAVSILTQAVGINAIIYYAPTIFQLTGFAKATSAILATAGVGLINVVFTVVAVLLLDKVGRRKMLMTGITGIILSLIVMTLAFAYGLNHSMALAWVAFFCMLLFVACQAIGTGPACWLIPSEIFPLKVRGVGMGTSVAFNWGTNVVVAFLFPIVLNHYGAVTSFASFLVIALFAAYYFYRFLPETKGISLEQIEHNLHQGLSTRQLGKQQGF